MIIHTCINYLNFIGRNGNEEKLVTLMGVMQALVSVIQDGKDTLRCIVAGKHKFVFMIREHVILVASANTHETIQQITLQLTYIYNQVLSVLTYTQLARIFKERHNYDLRRLLTGAEKFLDNLMTMMETDPSCLLGAVNCLSLDSSIRDIIAQAIAQHAKLKASIIHSKISPYLYAYSFATYRVTP